MKPMKPMTIVREGKKKFQINKDHEGRDIMSGANKFIDGSYIGMSMEETLKEVFETILKGFSLNKEFVVEVKSKDKVVEEFYL